MSIEGIQADIVIVSDRVIRREALLKVSRQDIEVMQVALHSVEEALKGDYKELDRLQGMLRGKVAPTAVEPVSVEELKHLMRVEAR